MWHADVSKADSYRIIYRISLLEKILIETGLVNYCYTLFLYKSTRSYEHTSPQGNVLLIYCDNIYIEQGEI